MKLRTEEAEEAMQQLEEVNLLLIITLNLIMPMCIITMTIITIPYRHYGH